MYLKVITKKGISRLYLYESYYKNGKANQRCIESLGRLDELQKQFDDPVSHFKKVAEEKNAEQNTSRKISVPIDLSSTMGTSEDNLKNVGYAVLKDLYKQLELDKFWKLILRKTSIQYDLEAVFRLLVFSRILYPGSKRETFLNKVAYFEGMDGFSLKDIYKALDVFDQYDEPGVKACATTTRLTFLLFLFYDGVSLWMFLTSMMNSSRNGFTPIPLKSAKGICPSPTLTVQTIILTSEGPTWIPSMTTAGLLTKKETLPR